MPFTSILMGRKQTWQEILAKNFVLNMIDIWKAIYNQLIQKLAVTLPISILYGKKKKLSNTNVVFI